MFGSVCFSIHQDVGWSTSEINGGSGNAAWQGVEGGRGGGEQHDEKRLWKTESLKHVEMDKDKEEEEEGRRRSEYEKLSQKSQLVWIF